MFKNKNNIREYDIKLWNAIESENNRQENHIELIASENYVSRRIMEAQGSQLTNKYAEGYPGKRYYNGCQHVDTIENIAIQRAKKLFKANYANVQPHSGSQANFAVYHALLNPGDKILGMDLTHGGHLTHGAYVNFSGKIYFSIAYGLNKNEEIDYENLNDLAEKHKPKIIVGGFSSYSGICNWKLMRKIADNIQAYLLVDMAHIAGLVATDLYPSPLPYAHVVTTTTHKTLAGPRGGLILSQEKDESLYKKINSSVFPGIQGGPLMHVIAAKAIAFKEAMEISFKEYQKQILNNAKYMSNIFIAEGYHVISGGTHNHLFLLNLENKKLTGKMASNLLDLANITVNKNSIPYDKQNPFVTSGIRIGTPAITRRGFKEKEIEQLTYWIINILNDSSDSNQIKMIKKQVLNMCRRFPVYI
ncbi:Serine hydroxymethyltransferase [Buchnera aphidicola (Eriosoma grossulariae)]|uniref:serine hydroxymethyltransferase n=1 Tax=Buchnera aphidicola TaxID=9 RepID=UPI0034645020